MPTSVPPLLLHEGGVGTVQKLGGCALPHTRPHDADTATWWLRAREAAPKQLRKDFDAVVILVHWRLWKERNSRIFDGVSMDTAAVLDRIIDELRTWRHAGCFASDLAI